MAELRKTIPTLCKTNEAKFIDEKCDWSCAKHWAQWWTCCDHQKMLYTVSHFQQWKKVFGNNVQAVQMLSNKRIKIVKVTHHNS